MSSDVRVDVHEAEVRAVMATDGFRRVVAAYGGQVGSLAGGLAPVRRTGSKGGARSIHGETEMGPDGWQARVSWDEAHPYMRFQNDGFRGRRGLEFMQKAADLAAGSSARLSTG